jgi:ribonuclease E
MLIDASHPEETRLVILSGNRVEEFDFESASKKPLKGNIYLAKVTRVEPSLQAAFIEYGGNRHGFLAFNEIHPDYYQIPVADRQALMAAQRAEERSQRYRDEDEAPRPSRSPRAERNDADPMPAQAEPATDESAIAEGFDQTAPVELSNAEPSDAAPAADAADAAPADSAHDDGDAATAAEPSFEAAPAAAEAPASEESSASDNDTGDGESTVEEVVVEEAAPEVISAGDDESDSFEEDSQARRRSPRMRQYKIQEVIKKRQILLIQVVKEERGNKGAALTTYLSLAGRYCVLMPNSGRGGGISRKITNTSDRRRLKDAAESLDVPEGMGLIVRTAGASRTKQEIQRDYEYLLRLWDSIRDLTLRSSAPALVYEEGNLIKRAIRDQFSRDIEEIVVEGAEGFREAQTFTKMIMPQQIDSVKLHDGRPPLFQKYKVESQLDSMFNPRVQLKSGGYLIINQTEALVAIDVNSGRSTREHNIEDTAHKTNLEAAEEVARQLRLRDLAGLIVIDFIDMEEGRNDRAVERRLKECLRHDRARIQLGRISPFGLLEMSRQRLRPGMVEGSTVSCPHCSGTGLIRSVESLALRAMRNIEEEVQSSRAEGVTARVPTEVALYMLNHKRSDIAGMEERLGISIFVEAKHDMFGADCEIELGTPSGFRSRRLPSATAVSAETALAMMPEQSFEPDEDDRDEPGYAGDESNIEVLEDGDGETPRERAGRDDRGGRKNGRRRGGRGREDRERRPREDRAPAALGDPLPVLAVEGAEDSEAALVETPEGAAAGALAREGARDSNERRRRRRGRRGGRRNGRPEGTLDADGNMIPGSDEPQDQDGDADGEQDDRPSSEQTVLYEGRTSEQGAYESPLNEQQTERKPERKSPAAAIARFFGFGTRQETRSEPAASEPQPAAPMAPEPAAPEPAAVEPPAAAPVAHEPVIEAPADVTPPEVAAPEPAPEAPAAESAAPVPDAHDPVPMAAEPEPAAEAAPHEPTPAEVVEAHDPSPIAEAPVEPESSPAPAPAPEPVTEAAAPAEPEAPRPIVIPDVPPAEIVVIGPAEQGPPKAGWWKKRD